MRFLIPVAAVVLTLTSGTTHASPKLMRVYPGNHVTLARPPDFLRLHFSEPVEISGVEIRRSARAASPLKPTRPGAARDIQLALPYLMPGHYTVTWQRAAADGTALHESTMFNVK